MQRIKQCAGFCVWALGLSYIALWAVSGHFAPTEAKLSPAMGLVGLLAAIAVFVRLLLIALRSGAPKADDTARSPRRRRRPDPTVARIKERDHFGLRGIER